MERVFIATASLTFIHASYPDLRVGTQAVIVLD
jgi:hypothetical protein